METEKTKEVSHEDQLRCPKCGHIYKLPEEWYHDCKSGAEEMRTYCPECYHDFEVIVATTYTFTSPAMLTEESEGTNDD